MDEQVQPGKQAEKDVPFRMLAASVRDREARVDMNQIVGKKDILFICLDTLRYDVAVAQEAAQATPVLNQYGPWEKCQAPGNFTYPSHHAMFAGFLPCQFDAKNVADRELLFFPAQIGLGKKRAEGRLQLFGQHHYGRAGTGWV